MSDESPQTAPAQSFRRSPGARGLALLLALLVILLQPRVFAASAVRLGPSVPRVVATHSQRVESNALRASAAARVAPPQTFFRAPCLPVPLSPRARPCAGGHAPRVQASQVRLAVSHFHSKRRIPRMNSDEPPRA